VIAICNCCWDCCANLRGYNMGAVALKYNSHFLARIKDEAECKACAVCEHFCPTTAISVKEGRAVLNGELCIGCGQCAYHCLDGNIELVPLEREVFLPTLKPSQVRIRA
jgi:Pyruvate/2-oxoacid:ferredoxin oxidoreductase delta subunit